MKLLTTYLCFALFMGACQNQPMEWDGSTLTQERAHLTVEELIEGHPQPLVDMSYFARPDWGEPALHAFSGTLSFQDTKLLFPKEKAYYPGEDLFPRLQIDFISHEGALIPRIKDKIITRLQSNSLWDVVLGPGKAWHEQADGAWSRASFPLTLTDRYVGQARNCVATFVYQPDTVSHVCLQCSQETADIDDKQLGNISGVLPVRFQAKLFSDSSQLLEQHAETKSNRLPVRPLNEIDAGKGVADYFEKKIYTHAPTSMGAVWMDGKLYVHPPKTRHGLYPYPQEMRHGLYSVTKSMAGALALMYFEERYEEDVFNQLITDHVSALANHEGWQGVTFAHALNMVTGTEGGEAADQLYSTLIVAETAEEAIHNIASLGDAPASPGQTFNYASTNSFVLSYALQNYVEAKEGVSNYWELVRKNVLLPIGAEHFSLLHTIEADTAQGIPMLAFGALPTLDEAAKIALLFANEGRYQGQQILNEAKVKEIFGELEGHSTNKDFRGEQYHHAFWSKKIRAGGCKITATYMLGFGENYVVFLPSGAIIFRFLDEHDLNIDRLIKQVEKIGSSCE